MNNLGRQQGFALIEALVTITLIILMSLVLLGLLIGHLRLAHTLSANAEMLNQRAQIEQEIEHFIHLSSGIKTSAIINGQTYTTSDQELVLDVPSVDSGGFVIPGSFDTVAFTLDDVQPERLLFVIEPAPASRRLAIEKVLSDSLKYLNFSYNTEVPVNTRSVVVRADLERTVFQRKNAISLYSLIHLRNVNP